MSDAEDHQHENERRQARIERAVKLAGFFGFNEVRVRWKIMNWLSKREREARHVTEALAHTGYEHAVCLECGRIQPRGNRTCIGCEAPMGSRFAQTMRRAGFISPVDMSASMVLGALILLCYARQIAFTGGSWAGFGGEDLIQLGAHYPPAEWQLHQWWRLGTAVFLHGGIMHLAFNMLALIQVGPMVEELFGRGRTAFLFVATGILANVPGLLMVKGYPSIGASGAIMGLIGVAAGWGQRDGTSIGIGVRNAMVKWLLYVTVMGLMFG